MVRFADGHMVKLKADWYVTRHRAIEDMSREKAVVGLLVADAVDDVKPLLTPEIRQRLEAFEQRFHRGVEGQLDRLTKLYADVRTKYGEDRKAFALDAAKSMTPHDRAVMFSVWAGRQMRAELMGLIEKNSGTAAGLDHVRWAFGGERWSFDFDGDA